MHLRGWGSLLLLLTVTPLIGCEEDVVAVLGADQPYTLWGVLNPLADTQFVRVFPIEGTLNPGMPEPLDARFVSTDLATGEERRWRDSVIVDARGIVGHVYYAPFRAAHAHTYRLEITGADGQTSSVEVAVPVKTTLTLGEPDTTQGVRLSVLLQGNPPRLIHSEVGLVVSYVAGFSDSGCPDYYTAELSIPYDERIRLDGGAVIVDLVEVFELVESWAEMNPFYLEALGITLAFIRFETVVVNEAWVPPNGVFDPDVLVQPGTMSNVEEGFGFVGAGYRLRRAWNLPVDVVEKAGFRTDYEEC